MCCLQTNKCYCSLFTFVFILSAFNKYLLTRIYRFCSFHFDGICLIHIFTFATLVVLMNFTTVSYSVLRSFESRSYLIKNLSPFKKEFCIDI